MKASIAEAARSADAMRDVAKALAAETEAARENLRAYLTVSLIGVIPQNKDTGYRYEVRMTLQNVGNTPAYNVASNFYADVLPNPPPQAFKIPAFNQKIAGESTVGPHQNAVLTAVAPRVYSDEDVNEITHVGVKKLLFVFGTVVYKDAFGGSRYIKVCQEILWLANGNQMSRNYGNYNEAN